MFPVYLYIILELVYLLVSFSKFVMLSLQNTSFNTNLEEVYTTWQALQRPPTKQGEGYFYKASLHLQFATSRRIHTIRRNRSEIV